MCEEIINSVGKFTEGLSIEVKRNTFMCIIIIIPFLADIPFGLFLFYFGWNCNSLGQEFNFYIIALSLLSKSKHKFTKVMTLTPLQAIFIIN